MLRTGLALERTGIAWYATARRFLDRLVTHARTTVVDGVPLSQRPDIRAPGWRNCTRCEAAGLGLPRGNSWTSPTPTPADARRVGPGVRGTRLADRHGPPPGRRA
jgi:alkylation response protein AidB-like acyl-CoA dehydrogenase